MSEPVSEVRFPGYWEKYRVSQPRHERGAFQIFTISKTYELNSLAGKQGVCESVAVN